MTTPNITIDMDRTCRKCGKKGATGSGLCLKCIAKRIKMPMKTEAGIRPPSQPPLIKMSAAELAELKSKLSGLVGEYIQLEGEKKAADEDWNGRMGELWEQIKLYRAKIEGVE